MSSSVIILAGAGHANIQCLKMLCMRPIPEVEVVLVSDQAGSPYSGMLPGHMMGKYSADEIHFNLWNLASQAKVTFIQDKITGVDPQAGQISFSSGRGPLSYDLVSFNLGISPEELPGRSNPERVFKLKPISQLLKGWNRFLSLAQQEKKFWKVAVVGGGAAGVETAVALSERGLQEKIELQVSLLSAADRLLPSLPKRASIIAFKSLIKASVTVRLNCRAVGIEDTTLEYADGRHEDFDFIFFATQPLAPELFSRAGLPTDASGYLSVNEFLQVPGRPNIFGAGDCVSFMPKNLAKAGVFAVRQGQVLQKNIRKFVETGGKGPMEAYVPQKQFLKLIHMSRTSALASRGPWLNLQGEIFSQWKENIDRKFMAMYGSLPSMAMRGVESMPMAKDFNMCLGCGAKVSQEILNMVVGELKKKFSSVLPNEVEDCYPLASASSSGADEKTSNYLSVDGLLAFLQDPFLMAKVAALHALSDLWVSGIKPHSLALSLGLAHRPELSQKNYLQQVMSGLLSLCQEHQIRLINAHTFENSDDHLSLTVIGRSQGRVLRKSGAKIGDLVILSKPLGVGILLQALQKGDTGLEQLHALFETLLRPNIIAKPQLFSSATDVTGFGLIGHLMELLEASKVKARLELEKIPLLPGVNEALARGHRSFLIDSNRRSQHSKLSALGMRELLDCPDVFHDPQTNGAILATISPENLSILGDVDREWHIIGEIL